MVVEPQRTWLKARMAKKPKEKQQKKQLAWYWWWTRRWHRLSWQLWLLGWHSQLGTCGEAKPTSPKQGIRNPAPTILKTTRKLQTWNPKKIFAKTTFFRSMLALRNHLLLADCCCCCCLQLVDHLTSTELDYYTCFPQNRGIMKSEWHKKDQANFDPQALKQRNQSTKWFPFVGLDI